jgi:putative hydrolase of the HAD superfamily
MEMVARRHRAIFFDAAGTLVRLTKTVGRHYAFVGERIGLSLDPAALDRAFEDVWKRMPDRPATGVPREDDDKGWWRGLVDQVLEQVAPTTKELDRDNFFEAAYAHFAEAQVWELYPETLEVLETLRPVYELGVISNFDGRLRMILEGLGIAHFFSAIVLSSEVGADKPDGLIFQRAAELLGVSPQEALHVGDDPVRDWQGAAAAGFATLELARPEKTLRDVLVACALT